MKLIESMQSFKGSKALWAYSYFMGIFDLTIALAILYRETHLAAVFMGIVLVLQSIYMLAGRAILRLSESTFKHYLAIIVTMQWGHTFANVIGSTEYYTGSTPFTVRYVKFLLLSSAIIHSLIVYLQNKDEEYEDQRKHYFSNFDKVILAFAAIELAISEGRLNSRLTPCPYFNEVTTGFISFALFIWAVYTSQAPSTRIFQIYNSAWLCIVTIMVLESIVEFKVFDPTTKKHPVVAYAMLCNLAHIVLNYSYQFGRVFVLREPFLPFFLRRSNKKEIYESKFRTMDSRETVGQAAV